VAGGQGGEGQRAVFADRKAVLALRCLWLQISAGGSEAEASCAPRHTHIPAPTPPPLLAQSPATPMPACSWAWASPGSWGAHPPLRPACCCRRVHALHAHALRCPAPSLSIEHARAQTHPLPLCSCLAATDLYRYLAQEHDATIIGLLLGMAASKRCVCGCVGVSVCVCARACVWVCGCVWVWGCGGGGGGWLDLLQSAAGPAAASSQHSSQHSASH
jgi:hypothetical protein